MQKEAPGKVWHPIEGLPDDAHTWRNEPYDRAREEWREVKAALARRGTDRYALEHQGEHDPRWSAILSVSSKLGRTSGTLRELVRQAERNREVTAKRSRRA